VFTGGAARLLCSGIFAGDRDPELVQQQDIEDRRSAPGKYLSLAWTSVDLEAKQTTASLFGWKSRTAVHRDGLGCTVADGASVDELLDQTPALECDVPDPDPSRPWPVGSGDAELPADVDGERLDAALESAFADPDPERPYGTRSVVVVHRGQLIAEQYADGFDKDTGHLSNSVAKSVTSSLIGILVGQGKLDVDQRAPIEEWADPEDPRSAITLDNLLRMSSGLEFEESYSKVKSDITMQYVGGDQAGFAAAKELEAEPGTRWHYSTGTANILGRIVRESAGGDDLEAGLAFPCEHLFRPLGMHTAVMEADAVGNFVGGSSVFASTRDYARLGLLYLRDGVWQGQRILPDGWVDYVTQHTPGSPPERAYGAQFWLNWDGVSDEMRFPQLPRDAFLMNGHQGQHVVMIPSLDLVVARNGLTEFGNWDLGEFVADVIEALPS
jgi:CubicO group peptidase (beta-lactamase class C family)